MAREFKKLSDVSTIESVSDSITVLVVEDGEVKQTIIDNVAADVDSTLSIKGAAADAKATGDAITGINQTITEHGESITQLTEEVSATVKTVNDNAPDENGNVAIEIPEGFSGSWNDLTDKPELATVATSGSYNDLANIPVGETKPVYQTALSEKDVPHADSIIYGEEHSEEAELLFLDVIRGGHDKPVEVVYDGEKYYFADGFSRLPYYASEPDDYGMTKHHVGNHNLCVNKWNGNKDLDGYGLEDNDLPFCLYIESPGSMIFYFADGQSHTVGVNIGNVETIILDPKFIPTTVPVIESATAGQTVVVKAVDENGKPTEWEAADFPEGFSGSYNDLTDKPELSAIATSGSYDDIDDRPFGEIITDTVCVPEATYTVLVNDLSNVSGCLESMPGLSMNSLYYYPDDNDLVTFKLDEVTIPSITHVRWNGVEYPFVMRGESSLPGAGYGNATFAADWYQKFHNDGDTDTGEPFLFAFEGDNLRYIFTNAEPGTQVTFEMFRRESHDRLMDARFLPATVPVIESAASNQTIVVGAVDENGKPTFWKTVDMASGGALMINYDDIPTAGPDAGGGDAASALFEAIMLADKAGTPVFVKKGVYCLPLVYAEYSMYERYGHEWSSYEFIGVSGSVSNLTIRRLCLFGNNSTSYTESEVNISETVKTVNETAPDENGNVNVTIPTTVPAVQTAAVGQTVVVKAVDENGKPTEWEAADAGAGSWNDLTNAPIFEKVLTETQLELDSADYTLVEGKLYKIVYDGVEYIRPCKVANKDGGSRESHYVGDYDLVWSATTYSGGEADPSIPVAAFVGGGWGEGIHLVGGESEKKKTAKLYEVTTEIAPLDPRFLHSTVPVVNEGSNGDVVVVKGRRYDKPAEWGAVPVEDILPTTVPAVQTAAVGQTVVVKAVDENGKPTEWEAADAGGGLPWIEIEYPGYIDKEKAIQLAKAGKRVCWYTPMSVKGGDMPTDGSLDVGLGTFSEIDGYSLEGDVCDANLYTLKIGGSASRTFELSEDEAREIYVAWQEIAGV